MFTRGQITHFRHTVYDPKYNLGQKETVSDNVKVPFCYIGRPNGVLVVLEIRAIRFAAAALNWQQTPLLIGARPAGD